MKINIKELTFTIKPTEDNKHPDLLAYVSMKFIDEHERHFTVNGFTIRKSKYDGNPYLVPPSKSTGKSFFKFVLVESSLWREIEKEAIKEYDYTTIPAVEEKD
ncbi:MAG: hypothetical protein KBH94_04220 [Caldisericia bacterium]|nr:hypothetical protein [Caldisericia bacterium]